MSFKQFKESVAKLKEPRKHKITNSVGIYQIYKYIRKNKWFNIGRPLKEKEFYAIISAINEELANNLMNSEDIKLPYQMGTIEVRKMFIKPEFKDGKLHIPYKVDWGETLKLWYEDEEAHKDKTLVRCRDNTLFTILFNKSKADFNNKIYFDFQANRGLKQEIKRRAKQGDLEAFLL